MIEERGLTPLLERHRMLVCVGSGGVGKTTVAAALALAAAQRGRHTLCLTIDPARRLANSLGLESMPTEQVTIAPEWLQEHGVSIGDGSLTVMMLDTKRTFDELVRSHAKTEASRERILNNRLYEYISRHLAGTQSYMAMEKVLMVELDESYDTIVLDTPPMYHALDFFEAPERMVEVIDSPALRGLVQAIQTSGRFSLNVVARSIGAVLRTIGRITGGVLLEEMAELVAAMNELFGGFQDRANQVLEQMQSPRFGYIAVSTPASLIWSEVENLDERMHARGLRIDALVVNRVHQARGSLPTVAEVEQLLHRRGVELEAHGAERMLQAAREESELAERQRLELDALGHRTGQRTAQGSAAGGKVPLEVRVPAFAADVHHPERLQEVAAYLCGGASG